VFWPNIFELDGFGIVRSHNMVPVREKRTLEDVGKLGETLLVAEVNFRRSASEVGDGPRDRELGAKLPSVHVYFGRLFLAVLVATQLVGLGKLCFFVP